MAAQNAGKAPHEALDAHAVQSSNATSNLFLGSARRSWMGSGTSTNADADADANNTLVQIALARGNRNTVSKRPRPQRVMSYPPAQPLDEDSTIEVVSRASSSRASPVRSTAPSCPTSTTIDSRLGESTSEVGGAARQEDTMQSRGVILQILNGVAFAPTTNGPPAIERSSTREQLEDQQQGEQEPPADACGPADTRAYTYAEDKLLAETLPIATDDPNNLSMSQPPTCAVAQPLLPSNPIPDPLNSLRMRADSSTQHTGVRHHLPSITATPPADVDNPDGSTKRSADISLTDERRVRARMNADSSDPPIQLPTPQDSPQHTNIPSLSEQFESKLAAVFSRPRTADQQPVIDNHRVNMMRDACHRNDRFYLLSHTIYCLWSATKWDILTQLLLTETHLQGVHALGSILGSNRNLTTQFPGPPEGLVLDNSHELKLLIEEVRCFLFHLGSSFAALQDAAFLRKCPPCPAEFKFSLKLPSPVLQKALFLSILRQTENDQAWLSLALSLFEKEMINPSGSAITIAQLNAYHGAQLNQIVTRWGLAYAQQRKDYQERRHAGSQGVHGPQMQHSDGRISGPPTVPANFHGSDQSTQSIPPAQFQNASVALSSPGQQQQFYSGSPPSFQNPSQLPQHPNQPSFQQQFYSPTPQSPAHAPRPTLSTSYSATHQTAPSQPPPQIPHSPHWRQSANTAGVQGSSRRYSQAGSVQFDPQSRSPLHAQPLPVQSTQAGPTNPEIASMASAGGPPASSTNKQSPRRGRPRTAWQVQAVVGERQRKGKTEFLVLWKGQNPVSNSWVPETNLRNAQRAIATFRSTATTATDPVQSDQNLQGRQLLNPGTGLQQRVVSPNSMPSALIQQQQSHHQQPASISLERQNAGLQQAAQPFRAQQPPTTTQSPSASIFQHPLFPQTSANASTSAIAPNTQVAPHSLQRSNPPAPAIVDTPMGISPPAVPAIFQKQPGTQTLPILNGGLLQSPLIAGAHQNTNSQQQVQPQQNAGPPQGQPFFPADSNYVLPQIAVPDPDSLALHQVELRSPEYHKIAEFDGTESNARYYQYVEGVIYLPELLTKDSDLIRWKLQIPQQTLLRKTIALPPVGEFLIRQRNVSNGDAQFRLKSTIFADQEGLTIPTLSKFCMQPAKWPKCLSISVNEHMGLDFRRKAHFGADLATDITEMLGEDENEVVISAIFTPQEANLKFLVALEIICVADHDTLLKMPARIPAANAYAAITNTLKTQSSDDDDLIIQPFVSIDLVDPFMSVIWVTPVRSRACSHRECFDLEAFLLSRTSRVKDSGVSSADKWYCPICRSDCRPPMLVLDEFLLDVRKNLENNDQLHAKAILVMEDGSWEPRLDNASKDEAHNTPDPDMPMTGMSDADADAAMTQPSAERTASASAHPSDSTTPRPQFDQRIVVILDDDD